MAARAAVPMTDSVSSTRGLRRSSDLGGIPKGEENLVTPTTPVGVAKPDLHSTYIVIGEELPRIPGCDVRDHGVTCSLLNNRKNVFFFGTKSGLEPGSLDLHNMQKWLFGLSY